MLEAFVLGFWIIWSSDREVYPLSESLWFTLIAVILRQLTAFDLPIIDTYWMIFNGIVWAFAGLIFPSSVASTVISSSPAFWQ